MILLPSVSAVVDGVELVSVPRQVLGGLEKCGGRYKQIAGRSWEPLPKAPTKWDMHLKQKCEKNPPNDLDLVDLPVGK